MNKQLSPFMQSLYHLGCSYRHLRNAFFAFPWLFIAFIAIWLAVAMTSCKTPTPTPKPPPAIVVTPAPTPVEREAAKIEAERLDAAAAAAKATALALEHAPASTPAKLATGENAIVQANLPPPTEPALAVAIGACRTSGTYYPWSGRCKVAYMTDGTLTGAQVAALHTVLADFVSATGR